jgi:hypothetical protein
VRKHDVGLELADALKYIICLAQDQGFEPETLLSLAYQKGLLLEKRFAQEWWPPGGRNVLVTDLDGTGADFQRGFGAWLALQGYVSPGWNSLNMDLDASIPYGEYERLKTQFESEGGYDALPVYQDWVELVVWEQRRGTFVMVATARPAEQIQRVGLDTMKWLERMGVQPDSILFGRDERILELLRLQQQNNRVVLLEDELLLARRAARNGIPVIVRAQKYNAELEQHRSVSRVERCPMVVDWDWVSEVSGKGENSG